MPGVDLVTTLLNVGAPCGAGRQFQLREVRWRDGPRRRPARGVRTGPHRRADADAGSGVCAMTSFDSSVARSSAVGRLDVVQSGFGLLHNHARSGAFREIGISVGIHRRRGDRVFGADTSGSCRRQCGGPSQPRGGVRRRVDRSRSGIDGICRHAGGPRNHRHCNRSHRRPHPPVLSSRNLRGWAAIAAMRPTFRSTTCGGRCPFRRVRSSVVRLRGLSFGLLGRSGRFSPPPPHTLSPHTRWRRHVRWCRRPDSDGATRDGWISVLRDALESPWSVLSLLLLGVDFLTIAAFNVALAPLVHQLYGNESWLGILDVCFAVGAIVAPTLWARYSSRVSSRAAVTSGFAIQIVGFATIALGLESGGALGQSAVPLGAALLGLGVAVSSSQQVSILQHGAKSSTLGRIGALRQAVIGLTTATVLPVVGYLVDKDLTAAYGGVVALLALGAVVNMGVARREKVSREEVAVA